MTTVAEKDQQPCTIAGVSNRAIEFGKWLQGGTPFRPTANNDEWKALHMLDGWDDGDTLSNCNNARKSSMQRLDGKGALRSSKQKRRLRTIMNKRKRAELKRELRNEA